MVDPVEQAEWEVTREPHRTIVPSKARPLRANSVPKIPL
jgi:hypothetical protein